MPENTLFTKLCEGVSLALISTILFVCGLVYLREPILQLMPGTSAYTVVAICLVPVAIVLHLGRKFTVRKDYPVWTMAVTLLAVPVASWTGAIWHRWVHDSLRLGAGVSEEERTWLIIWFVVCVVTYLGAVRHRH